ncbi:TPA: valine--tRNA ligase [Legionella pneumophila]|uniref:Valine--tRNA ligase n=1 Tax=Legionella pneumophila (strain Lens) TaxID=297245 RepID=SYV_LEGPL|nr:valine--tRNA ligase [Legionella pneumophila]Q5WYI0.1 RecName: Full=Valine--tRNA ligase; AltName: Full=Valyl-tRNA synthetase; Short=ValRS [Legionella pneumophila str. Lens]AOW52606.1 valine--tRNA ligase [Legionella pneumophila subsp. pneumophila]AOW56490.1 valine--tRNA ligase [Legionella pneumophila subsp. pneumophila]AOW63403.1 valine--tRNA ligase [Legionella pneumophila subsp. pneumophila]RYW83621.1 valine--tRNA ligase [Legionella pneumophila]RYW88099.1 valine--tRNA ligase [Legionella pne
MDKTYSPEAIEKALYKKWESHHYFQPRGEGKRFCIMLPPPNVTGSLHMGHGFQHTIMDALTRYHRMLGDKTLWQPGTDHAGISTQLVVERQLEAQGVSRKELTREQFLDKVWQWKEESGNTITQQMRRLGASVDWSRERFTMDEGLSAAVQKVFVQLYEEGLIYRGTRLVNWDPKLGTAVSDLEVLSEEEDGFLWHIRYPVVDSEEFLIVATTRPETLLGDCAVAVHPDDSRFRHLIGKQVHLPLCDRTIPVIADDYVDKEFGSGCVKITPAHDFNDHEVGKRHQLPQINILTKKGTINKNAPLKYQGMDRFLAREQIIKDLEQEGLLAKTEPHKLKVPRGEKSNVIIEPLLTDQWYVKTKPLAEPAIAAVKKGDIRFIPETWDKTYFQWMDNIEDWCISRQLWWGHRIPAWYDNHGNIYVGYSENDVRFKHKIDQSTPLKQDEDVLDTWFSSALWPFSTLGWPERTPELEQFYPTSVLVTGFDIIFFWVARMIMMGLKFTGKIPFKEVFITGLIRDSEGHKMSKSKGNVLDPLDIVDGIELDSLIAKRTSNLMLNSVRDRITKATRKEFPEGISAYGTDALRFTYCSLASTGRNVRFDLGRVEGYRNFCNKLWNAARYVLLNTDEEQIDFGDGAFQYSPADQWILSRLQNTVSKVHHYFETYRFDLLANTLYEFVWHEYCDWYLELSKPILQDDQALSAMKRGTRRTLIHVLDQILKLLHPLMPFITEEIWQKTTKFTSENGISIMLSTYPKVNEEFINPSIEEELDWLKSAIQSLRTIRSEMSISPAKLIPLYIRNITPELKERIAKYEKILKTLSKIDKINYLAPDEKVPVSATAVLGEIELLIPMADLIDKEAELSRLNKELAKLNKDIELAQGKLNNPKFTDKAPEEIIAKEKDKLAQAQLAKDKLLQHKNRIESL